MGEIGAGKTVEYTLHGTDMGVYVFLIEGEVKIDDVILTHATDWEYPKSRILR